MKNKIEDLRNHLFATLESLRDETQPMEIDRALAIAEVSKQIIETAKTEVAAVKVLSQAEELRSLPFFESQKSLRSAP